MSEIEWDAILEDRRASEVQEFIDIARWDWLVTPSGSRLHHAPLTVEDVSDEWCTYRVRTTCGRLTVLRIPDLGARLSMPRCGVCCDRTGMPRGDRSPWNDPARRAILAAVS